MKNHQTSEHTRTEQPSGVPIQLKIMLGALAFAVVALIARLMGLI
jgi:hypothetical protein